VRDPAKDSDLSRAAAAPLPLRNIILYRIDRPDRAAPGGGAPRQRRKGNASVGLGITVSDQGFMPPRLIKGFELALVWVRCRGKRLLSGFVSSS
jgi:hypothetical protein